MGTELSARGWTFGNRLTVYDEVIPAVPNTTRPIGADIDGRLGVSERVRLQLPERALIQFTHVDNHAELLLRRPPDIPWRTKFNIVSGEWGSTGPTILLGEWVYGMTQLGFRGGSFTMDFDTAYLLLSHKSGTDRWSVRVERFSTRSHNRRPLDFSRERGHAFTLAWFRDTSPHVRSGIEYLRVKGDRPSATDPRTGGSTITVEVRYRF
jgi:hypothetical protein